MMLPGLILFLAASRSDFNAVDTLATLVSFRKEAMKDVKTQEAYEVAHKAIMDKALAATKDVKLSDVEASQCLPLSQIYSMGEQWHESVQAIEKFLTVASTPAEKFQGHNIAIDSASRDGDIAAILNHTKAIDLPDSKDGLMFARRWIGGTFYAVIEKGGIGAATAMAYDLNDKVKKLTKVAEADKLGWQAAYSTEVANALADSGDTKGALARIEEGLKGLDAKTARSLTLLKTQLSLPGKPYPALKFTTGLGTFDEDAMVGKVVILDFFAHWCGPCIASFPEMEKMYGELHGKGLEVVGITRYYGYYGAENREKRDMKPEVEIQKMGEFKKQHNIPWSVMYGDASNFENYGCAAIPYVVVIDKKGNVRKIKVGYDAEHFAEFQKFVEGLLAE